MLFIPICILALLSSHAIAAKIYGATALTGGAAGALDAIADASLADKDCAVVFVQSGSVYHYVYKADSTAAESSPTVITPDDVSGDGRWLLEPYYIASGTYEPAFDFGTGVGDINTDDIPEGSTNKYEADSGTNTGDETAASIEGIMTGADAVTTIADADTMSIVVGGVLKKITGANAKTEFGGSGGSIDIITVTETGALTADQLTGSRIEYTGTGTATFTLGTASDAYALSQGASTFIFLATHGAYFDPVAGDKITYIDGSIHTLDDGDKLAALTPSKYDAFTIRPVKDGADYQWLIHCSTGLYGDGGP